MFRTQNNVPDNYTSESRDFQLLSRLYDLTYNSLRYDIDSMINLNDPMKINDRFLNLLATKVGFITDKNIDVDLLRYILTSFLNTLKYKGSLNGVKQAITTILRFENKLDVTLEINYDVEFGMLNIYTTEEIDNKDALDEYLKYILPAGCVYSLHKLSKSRKRVINSINIVDVCKIERVKTELYSSISKLENMNKDEENPLTFPDIYQTNNQSTQIVGIDNLDDSKQTTTNIKKVRTRNVKK